MCIIAILCFFKFVFILIDSRLFKIPSMEEKKTRRKVYWTQRIQNCVKYPPWKKKNSQKFIQHNGSKAVRNTLHGRKKTQRKVYSTQWIQSCVKYPPWKKKKTRKSSFNTIDPKLSEIPSMEEKKLVFWWNLLLIQLFAEKNTILLCVSPSMEDKIWKITFFWIRFYLITLFWMHPFKFKMLV